MIMTCIRTCKKLWGKCTRSTRSQVRPLLILVLCTRYVPVDLGYLPVDLEQPLYPDKNSHSYLPVDLEQADARGP